MPRFVLDLVIAVRVFLMCRTDLALEILALRQQVTVLKRKRPRPKLSRMDREAGDCGGLASRRISVVLALAVSRTRPW
jgi:hypothetical protein